MGRTWDWLTGKDLETRSSWFTPANTVAVSNPLADRRNASAADTVMAVPVAVRCIEILSTQVAQFPAKAFRGDDELDPQPRLLRRPDPFSSYYAFTYATVMDMLFHGTAAWLTSSRTPTGETSTLRHLPARDLEIRWEPSIPVAQARLEQAREIKYGGVRLDPRDVTLIPMIEVPGEACGIGPVQAGQSTLAGQVQADAMVRSNFTEGIFPSGTVSVPTNLSRERADELKRNFMDRAGSRAPVVMSGGAEFHPHAVTARDSQWIEARQLSSLYLTSLFGVPPAMCGVPVPGGSQVTYSNATAVRTELLHTGLGPINARLENAWGQHVPSTQDVHLDTTDYLPPVEAIIPGVAADPNGPPAPPATPPTEVEDPTNGNTAVM